MICLGNIDQSPCQGLSSKEKDLHLIGQLLYIVVYHVNNVISKVL